MQRLALVVCLLTACRFAPGETGGGDDDGSGSDAGIDGGSGSGSNGSNDAPTCGNPGSVRDDFNGTVIADQWYQYNLRGTVSETNQALSITPINNDMMNRFTGVESKNAFDMRRGQVTVEITQMVDNSMKVSAGLYLATPTEIASLVYAQGMVQGTVGTAKTTPVAYDATMMKWWRISNDGSLLHFWTSPDGVTFNELGAGFPVDFSIVHVFLGGNSSQDGNVHGTVTFDSLNLDTPATPWCKSHTFVDPFMRTTVGDNWYAIAGGMGPMGCTPTVSATGAQFATHDMAARCWLQTEEGFDLSSDYVTVDVPAIATLPTNFQVFLRVVSDTTANAFQIYFLNNFVCGQLQSLAVGCTSYDSSKMEYWRIGENNHTLAFETSPDKVTWTKVMPDATETSAFSVNSVHVEIGVDAPTNSDFTQTVSGYNTAF
ncbi:MAG: hypothetical protein QM831_41845 [Kofleriaceae bacterium]